MFFLIALGEFKELRQSNAYNNLNLKLTRHLSTIENHNNVDMPDRTPRKTVVVIDGHPLTRRALCQLIETERDLMITGQASDFADALSLLQHSQTDLAIIDLRLDNGSGLQLIKEIRQHNDATKILVYTSYDGSVYAERALKAGAQGYISKRDEISDCLKAVHRVLQGEIVLSQAINQKVLANIAPSSGRAKTTKLTDRELRVLELIGSGFSTREIAAQLELSTKTIESHRERIKAKLNITCASRLNRHAVEWVLTRT